MCASTQPRRQLLGQGQINDLRLTASKMTGAKRRAFMAEMTLKYCGGSARLVETVFGWGREAIEVGLAEKRTGLICFGAQSAYCGREDWEETQPEAATVLRRLAEAHAQQDPTFHMGLAYTRLTAKAAGEALRGQGARPEDQLPSPSTMAEVLNRMGYRLRKVVKAKPRKKLKQTDAIFDNIKKNQQALEAGNVKRLSMDCKATVAIGEFSRGGLTRGDNKTCDRISSPARRFLPRPSGAQC